MSGLRYAGALVAAVTVTTAMFSVLRLLIDTELRDHELAPAARIELARSQQDSELQLRRHVKPTLELPAQAPSGPMAAAAAFFGAGPPVITHFASVKGGIPGFELAMDRGSGNGIGTDREAIPLVRLEPEYPLRALQRGVEGWVLLKFDITPAGTVKYVSVVESEPSRVFDKAAMAAVSRWKYNPKIEEGVAVGRRGVYVVLRFQIDDSPLTQ